MAIARAELIPTSPNPLWFNLATDWIMKDLQNRLGYPLEAGVRREQERVAAENKKFHDAARKLEFTLIPLAIAALAIVGWNNKDQIISALDLNGVNQAPVPNVIVPPATATERRPTQTFTPSPTFTTRPSETPTRIPPRPTKNVPRVDNSPVAPVTPVPKVETPLGSPPPAASTAIPDATEIPVDQNAEWKPINDGSGDLDVNVLGGYDPCPPTDYVIEMSEIRDIVPSSGYEYLIGQTRIICRKTPQGTIAIKYVWHYVSVLPTP